MKILNEILDSTYVINLDAFVDRLNNTKKQLNMIGINNFIRFSAICPNHGNYEDRILGNKLSHLEVLKMVHNNKNKFALILEDDIEISPKFKSIEPNICSFIESNNFDIIWLGGSHREQSHKTQFPNIHKINNVATAHAYIINGSIALKTYNEIAKNKFNVKAYDDALIQYVQSLGMSYAVRPNVIFQSIGNSFAEGRFVDYSWIREYEETENKSNIIY